MGKGHHVAYRLKFPKHYTLHTSLEKCMKYREDQIAPMDLILVTPDLFKSIKAGEATYTYPHFGLDMDAKMKKGEIYHICPDPADAIKDDPDSATYPAWAQSWTEYEFGTRPDGITVHLSQEAAEAFKKDMESRGNSSCYTRSDGIHEVKVTKRLYALVLAGRRGFDKFRITRSCISRCLISMGSGEMLLDLVD